VKRKRVRLDTVFKRERGFLWHSEKNIGPTCREEIKREKCTFPTRWGKTSVPGGIRPRKKTMKKKKKSPAITKKRGESPAPKKTFLVIGRGGFIVPEKKKEEKDKEEKRSFRKMKKPAATSLDRGKKEANVCRPESLPEIRKKREHRPKGGGKKSLYSGGGWVEEKETERPA